MFVCICLIYLTHFSRIFCLILASGRRGVFDGVIEGLHQHWKYREVVKVISKQRLFQLVVYTAKFLEAESRGVLVSVEKLKEGHAIILYRGKNYKRPLKQVPNNLLTKREALHKSLEMQRIGVSEDLDLSILHLPPLQVFFFIVLNPLVVTWLVTLTQTFSCLSR